MPRPARCRLTACLLILATGPAAAAITVDGRFDEPEWLAAAVCSDWVRTRPYTLDAPRYRSDARMVATEAGLAVALTLDQPAGEPRSSPRTPRDAADFHGDFVSVIVDFDADGQIGFEFAVALGNGVRDGLVTNQRERNADWDGVWQHAVRETDDAWFVEMLVPWSTPSMRETAASGRTIAAYFERTVFDRNERFACPGAAPERPAFLSEFRRYTIPQYSARQLDVVPYATWVSDQLNDRSQLKAGADITWKPSNALQLVAAINPDFGQVESDELVINFSAIETVFTDKRPFFTENQGVFDLRTPEGGQLIYTRRVGAASDDGLSPTSDIDAALKVNGSLGRFVYGAFAAQEDGYASDTGRLFAATRVSLPLEGFRVGHLATFTDRPFLDRKAIVNAADFEFNPAGPWRWSGQLIRSDTREAGIAIDGHHAWLQTDFSQTALLTHSLELEHIDARFDLNDLGYLGRNDLRRVAWESRVNRAAFPEGSRRTGEAWQLDLAYRENTDGARLPVYATLIRDTQYASGWLAHEELNYETSGTDDLLSRGNGPVRLPVRAYAYGRYTTPRYGAWQHAVAGYVFQEGVDGFSYELELSHFWYPQDGLTFNLSFYPRYSSDWLLWSAGNLFGSYETRRLDVYGRLDWLPAPGHELRVKLQWIGIEADPDRAWRTTARGDLARSTDVLAPFAVNNLGLQIRYRYQFGPLSDLYVVYSRGGYEFREDDDRSLRQLLGDSGEVRDADQFLVKVRYRL